MQADMFAAVIPDSEADSEDREELRVTTRATSNGPGRCWAASAQVDRVRGARAPLTLRGLRGADDEGRGLKPEGSTKQREDVLFYVWVHVTDRGKTPVGFQKGNILPQMGSGSFSMFDSR